MTHDETAAHLTGGLPPYYPSSSETGNYKLMQAVADEFDNHETDINDINDAISPKNADTIHELRELGKLVGALPNEGESLEHYRARVIVEYALSVGTGTANELVSLAAYILDVSEDEIHYENVFPSDTSYGVIGLGLPPSAFNNYALTDKELIAILDNAVPAGYRIEGYRTGEFEHITVVGHNSNVDDPEKAYGTLDSNGMYNGDGGVYAGLLKGPVPSDVLLITWARRVDTTTDTYSAVRWRHRGALAMKDNDFVRYKK